MARNIVTTDQDSNNDTKRENSSRLNNNFTGGEKITGDVPFMGLKGICDGGSEPE